MPLSNLGILPIFENYTKSIQNIRSNLSKFNIETVGSVVGTFRYGNDPKTEISVIEGEAQPLGTVDKILFKLFRLAFPLMIFTVAIPVIGIPIYILLNFTNQRFIESLTRENLFIGVILFVFGISLLVIIFMQKRKNLLLLLSILLISSLSLVYMSIARTMAILLLITSFIFIILLIYQSRKKIYLENEKHLYLIFWSIFVFIFYLILVNRFFIPLINL